MWVRVSPRILQGLLPATDLLRRDSQ
ncbi:protein of unknown function [Ralstonia solanacearum CMR15]|nr:protein of unknown function [Ralstonia solanacearum CMR15]